MIRIVDYGMGNLRSVQKAFEKLGVEAQICSRAEELEDAEKLVLPGVGAFRDAARELADQHLDDPIRAHIASGKPFLGICLGLQLLFDVSYEEGEWPGLGIIPGKVVRFDDQPGLKIPHMGWNRLERVPSGNTSAAAQSSAQANGANPLLAGIPDEACFYFVHSYYVVPEDESVIAARTGHGIEFVSMIARDQMFASQFHPEKSQRAGLKLLENFAAL